MGVCHGTSWVTSKIYIKNSTKVCQALRSPRFTSLLKIRKSSKFSNARSLKLFQ